MQLTGTRPAAGSYEGFVTISGGSSTLKVPYLYLVGDGIPANIFAVNRGSFTDVVNQTDLLILFKLIDRYGLPVRNYPVLFKAVTGGRVTAGDRTTDIYGLAGALVNLGSQPGDQIFTGSAGGLTVEFDGTRARPAHDNQRCERRAWGLRHHQWEISQRRDEERRFRTAGHSTRRRERQLRGNQRAGTAHFRVSDANHRAGPGGIGRARRRPG